MKYKVTLRGKTYEVEVEAGEAILIDEYEAYAPAANPASPDTALPAAAPAAAPSVAAGAGETVASPMPGNILTIKVSQGEKVKAGQVIIVLEAMKMENEIVASKDGTILQIITTKGSVVDTGTPLFVIG